MAISTATITFTATGAISQAFSWSPALTSNPPKVLSSSLVMMSATESPPSEYLVGIPTNSGGTVAITGSADCIVTLVGSD